VSLYIFLWNLGNDATQQTQRTFPAPIYGFATGSYGETGVTDFGFK